jgi:hypothetical protein
MSPSIPPLDPPPDGRMQHDAGPQLAAWPAETSRAAAMTGGGRAITTAGAGSPGSAHVDTDVQNAELPSGVEVLERLSQRLTMAGLRLASLRRRLAGVEDRMMLIQASDDLDEAIAEVRRLALTIRGSKQR